MPRYPIEIGCVDFRSMRERQLRYVDKTAFIAEFLAPNRPTVSLITRPRRFGKTLTLNMLKEFFDIRRKGTKSFDGLAIKYNHTLCDEWMNKFPILSLSLKDVGTGDFSRALGSLRGILSELCDEHAYLADSPQLTEQNKKDFQALTARQGDLAFLSSSLRLLCRLLVKHWDIAPIILIDEYDVPLARAMQYGYYDEMKGFLRDFFSSAMKDSTLLTTAVLTGCLRITRESLFTGLNNFKCYGISDTRFADKLGFTSTEVDILLKQAGMPEKKPLLKEWYDGYQFGPHKEIYCPWDILQYLADCADNPDQSPQCYWINTSENFLLKQFIEETRLPLSGKLRTLAQGNPIITTIDENITYGNLYSSEQHLWSILYMTGYLTKLPESRLAQIDRTLQPGQTALVLPNKEIRKYITDTVDMFFTENLQKTDYDFFNSFWLPEEKEVSTKLTELCINSISYHDYYEHFYHALVLGLFLAFQYDAVSNLERGLGRSDIIVHHPNMTDIAIIELKKGREKDDLEDLAEQALEQIRLKQYNTPYKKPGARIFCWGMAFAQKECVARCRLVEC